MGRREGEEEEPLTPVGRFFCQPQMYQVISCVVGLRNPIEVDAIKAVIESSLMVQHPRFCSLLVRDKHGREHWRRTKLELEKHVMVRDVDGDGDEEELLNDYLADLSVSSPLDPDKPLWEIHVLKRLRCCVLRIHHALGDGISLMSLFLACCRRVDHPDQLPSTSIPSSSSSNENSNSSNICRKMWRSLAAAWFTLVYVLEFILRCLCVKDAKTAVSGGAGVELWPRKVATARFQFHEMKTVKKAVPGATINDVLVGVISSGLARYLDLRSQSKLREGLQITGLAMVNLRKQPGLQELSTMIKSKSKLRWGNKFGFVLLPVYYHKHGEDPLQQVREAKAILERKKNSLAAQVSYAIAYISMSLLGPKITSLLNYRILRNTTFTLSNVVGPQEEIMLAGNPITYIRANTSSLPHAITIHMVTYAGMADLHILVAKEIIPDPKVLANCLQNALLEMKNAAAMTPTMQNDP